MVSGSPYNPVSMTKKVSESRASLPRPSQNELDEVFSSISPEASAYVSRNPALRAKLMRAADRLGEAFPGRALHLVVAFDHESGDRDLFMEIERAPDWRDDSRRLRDFVDKWIHDREDPKLEVNFDFYFRR
jgi:hypothetical protein